MGARLPDLPLTCKQKSTVIDLRQYNWT